MPIDSRDPASSRDPAGDVFYEDGRVFRSGRSSMPLAVARTPLEGVLLIDPAVFPDERGFFLETWNQQAYAAAGIPDMFVQDAHSGSSRGVLRGLHYQDMTAPLAKLVRCTVGRIFDVAVDLRAGSPTFGRWFGIELTAENKRQVYVPVGFAHGFQTLSDYAEVQYKQTGFYTPPAEGVLRWDDPEVSVSWPISAADRVGP